MLSEDKSRRVLSTSSTSIIFQIIRKPNSIITNFTVACHLWTQISRQKTPSVSQILVGKLRIYQGSLKVTLTNQIKGFKHLRKKKLYCQE